MSNDPLGGMSTRPVPLDRLAQLEQQVRTLQSQIDSLRAEPRQHTFYQCRLCETCAAPEEAYPTAGSGANTFGIRFLDAEFSEEEGGSATTFTALSAGQQKFGKTADEAYVPEETKCLAVKMPDRRILLIPLECG